MLEVTLLNKYLAVFLSVVLTACSGTPLPVISTPSADQIEAEEQAVYSAALRNLYSATNYVLMDTTATSLTGVDGTGSTLARVMQDMPAIDQQTADSFWDRNDAAYPLSPAMELAVGFVLLSQAEKGQIFGQNRDGWQLFYEQYPNAPGITSLSRVGFNPTLDQALVYVGTLSHWLAGAGYFVLFKKVNGAWTLDQQVMTWIS
jgi:hypothetical protein